MPSAGRRIFLPDGTLVNFVHQLYKDCCVYISMGEPFKDPYEVLRGMYAFNCDEYDNDYDDGDDYDDDHHDDDYDDGDDYDDDDGYDDDDFSQLSPLN